MLWIGVALFVHDSFKLKKICRLLFRPSFQVTEVLGSVTAAVCVGLQESSVAIDIFIVVALFFVCVPLLLYLGIIGDGATNSEGTVEVTSVHLDENTAANVGILGIEVYFPSTFVDQGELESANGVSKGKYTLGLGQDAMAFTGDVEDVNSLALTAVQGLLETYRIPPHRVGRLEVGTETLVDKSKSTKTVLMQLFEGSCNRDIEGATVVNACYGGTAALLNALSWVESAHWDGRYAVVVAADIAVYERGPARPTGGCGAVALLLGRDAPLAVDLGLRATYAAHTWDFHKPFMGSEYPEVDGRVSQACFFRALEDCYERYAAKHDRHACQQHAKAAVVQNGEETAHVPLSQSRQQKAPPAELFSVDSSDYFVFHSPYHKLVQHGFGRLLFCDAKRRMLAKRGGGKEIGVKEEGVRDDGEAGNTIPGGVGAAAATTGDPIVDALLPWLVQSSGDARDTLFTDKGLAVKLKELSGGLFREKVAPSTILSRQLGNTYTAAVFSNIASLVHELQSKGDGHHLEEKTVSVFSYGSGALATMYHVRGRRPASSSSPFTLSRMAEGLNLSGKLSRRVKLSPMDFTVALDTRAALCRALGARGVSLDRPRIGLVTATKKSLEQASGEASATAAEHSNRRRQLESEPIDSSPAAPSSLSASLRELNFAWPTERLSSGAFYLSSLDLVTGVRHYGRKPPDAPCVATTSLLAVSTPLALFPPEAPESSAAFPAWVPPPEAASASATVATKAIAGAATGPPLDSGISENAAPSAGLNIPPMPRLDVVVLGVSAGLPCCRASRSSSSYSPRSDKPTTAVAANAASSIAVPDGIAAPLLHSSPSNDFTSPPSLATRKRAVSSGGSSSGDGAGGAAENFSRSAFDPLNLDRLVRGENCIEVLDEAQLDDLVEKNVVMLKKDKVTGQTTRLPQTRPSECIKLAALLPPVDLTAYGVDPRVAATMDSAAQAAVAAGLEALRDAGLVPGGGDAGSSGSDGWKLPVELRDSTGVLYASSYPGLDAAVAEVRTQQPTKQNLTNKEAAQVTK
jgi:hydroxymethylglutaryl-CoA synthase